MHRSGWLGEERAARSIRKVADVRQSQIRAARDELAMLRLKYTERHPEVVAAKKRVAGLEEEDGFTK